MTAFIEGDNGERIYVVQDNSADGYSLYSSVEGKLILVDEDAVSNLSTKLSGIQTELTDTRELVTNGDLTRIRSITFAMMPDIQFQQVDALNLKLGGFDDALELQKAYREVYYKGKADQVERINHGYATGEQVSRDIMQTYLDEDGNVSATVDQVGSEFSNSDGITESDVNEAENDSNPPV
ncbi:hypothetical protein [Glycomyces arizonensis]|uniref:hypothetical protein n=1 Tax=Glycomyces arizonensis TaxID=256035 RepID=UPI00041AA2A3|nr:hypothetical protein [Glycomyces arizonensis]